MNANEFSEDVAGLFLRTLQFACRFPNCILIPSTKLCYKISHFIHLQSQMPIHGTHYCITLYVFPDNRRIEAIQLCFRRRNLREFSCLCRLQSACTQGICVLLFCDHVLIHRKITSHKTCKLMPRKSCTQDRVSLSTSPSHGY